MARKKSKVLRFPKAKRGGLVPKLKVKSAKPRTTIKDEVQASDAVLKFPTSRAKTTEEFVTIPASLQSEASEAAGYIGAHKKRLQSIYGADPVVPPIIQRLAKLPEGRRSTVIRQINHLIERLVLDNQPELPLHAPGSRAPDAGPIFDQTETGERHDAERADDPARARKRKDDGHKGPRVAEGLSPEAALQGFKDAAAKKKAGQGELNADDKPGTYELQ
jgi:hypothetical protein